jgi:ubiquinone/menaquinone biosynthesis C-methylase UbiE
MVLNTREAKRMSLNNASARKRSAFTKISQLWWRLVRFGFRLLYNEMAWTYDGVSWVVSLGQWRNWQRAVLKHLNAKSGAVVLELAHGTGNLQLDLAKSGYERVALDYSPAMGRIAQAKLRRNGVSAPLVRARGQALPFADNTFSAVVSTFPTPFIIEAETLQEVYRVLKPGGCLVVVMNAIFTRGGVVKETLEVAYRVTGQRGDWGVDLPALFEAAGFEVSVAVEPCRWSVAQVLIATRPLDEENRA